MTAAPKRVVIEDHDGSTLYTDTFTQPTVITASVYVVLIPDRTIRYGGSGPAGEQVSALASFFMATPGLLDAVIGMKALFEKGPNRDAK